MSAQVPFEAGEYVIDLVQERDPEADPSTAVVIEVTDVRADEYEIAELGGVTVAEAAPDWPAAAVEPEDGYDADADCVVLAVFVRALERMFASGWAEWDIDKLRTVCVNTDEVTVYSYHSARLAPTPWKKS